MARGRLRIYLGAAPGVGKTYAMLEEGQRLRSLGADVLVGFVEPHGRRPTAAMAEGLETEAGMPFSLRVSSAAVRLPSANSNRSTCTRAVILGIPDLTASSMISSSAAPPGGPAARGVLVCRAAPAGTSPGARAGAGSRLGRRCVQPPG